MIYLDNCATTYPKPLSVRRAIDEALIKYGANSGRGGFQMSVKTSEKIYECREKVATFFNVPSSANVAFTLNCTLALNMAIKGLVNYGDHVIISDIEHNAVIRPVDTMAKRGYISYSVAKYSENDDDILKSIESLITPKTKLIVTTHASNVFGVVMPINKIGELAARHGINYIVDAAQSAGLLEIDMVKDNITALCMPGHKGLYGPMGVGVLAVNGEHQFNSIIEGGTGSNSASLLQPDFLPDLFESGTVNTSGIIGLCAGITFVENQSLKKIRQHEYSLTNTIYSRFSKNEKIKLYTPKPEYEKYAPIISFNYKDYPSEKTANMLSNKGIAVRAGFHCAYAAHRTFGTEDIGTVRISPSMFTSTKEIDVFCATIAKFN